jgi:hypothetical protein
MRHVFLITISAFFFAFLLVHCGKKAIKPDSVRASSSLSENNYTHAPENTLDGVAKTAWVDGNGKASGVGEWLEYTFSTPTNIGKIVITGGYQKTHETMGNLFELNSRPKTINILINGKSSQRINLADTREAQDFVLNNGKDAYSCQGYL